VAEVQVDGSFTIAEAKVDVIVSHTYMPDVFIMLEHGDTSYPLMNCDGNEGSGRYELSKTLDAVGQQAGGVWRLVVADYGNQDSGSLESFSLTLTPEQVETDTNPVVLINEFLADPADGAAGDANSDGVRDASDDEFVEIVNAGEGVVDLSGWTIADEAAVRFTLPNGLLLQPGKAVVIFGGGEPTGDFGGSPVYAADLLSLNNSGDTVTVSMPDGTVADSVSYGREGGQNVSLTRSVDMDPTAEFVQHPGDAYSPGTRQDRSAF
jgi:hypothetical protein